VTITGETIVGCSCPGCGEMVQHVAAQYTPSGEEEFWRFDFEWADYGDCSVCRQRPEED
jgi:hypothetical protein